MKLLVAIITGMLLALPTGRANAEPVDCEAARCTVQSAIDTECPCAEAKNHSRYTSCVSRVVNGLVRTGMVPKKCRTKIEGCAIRSTCGKRDGSVSCQLPGSPVTSRCRPLSSETECTGRGGTVVASCCDSCSGPVPTVTPTETVPTPTATEVIATVTATPIATATETPVPTAIATEVPVATATATPVVTATETPVPTATETPVATATQTPAVTATATETPVPTATETPAVTATATQTPVATVTQTPAVTATATQTPAVTATATQTPAVTATATQTPVATITQTPAVTATATQTPVATVTQTPVVTATATQTPVATATQTAVPTATVTAVPTTTKTATPVPTATVTATVTATKTATPVVTPTATKTATATPSPTATSTPSAPVCGDGIVNGTEQCDPPGSSSCPNAGNGLQVCSLSCTCACPGKLTFAGDATSSASVLDTGWTGISHRAPIISNGEVTVGLSGCTNTKRPCGVCNIVGPIANPNAGAGQLANRRCSNDSSIKCTADTPCLAGGGTCKFYFGSNLPLAAGGVSTCVVNQFNGAVSGTANIESGDAETIAKLSARVYNGITVDSPCPQCVGDTTINDGVAGGHCDGGPRVGQTCDGNGMVPGRPDFGTTSLDCPPNPAGIIATLPIDLSNRTGVVTRTLTTSSPNCSGSVGNKCLCDTCNNANAEPCNQNADCPDPAGPVAAICGGRRCLSGANNGTPCSNNTECPGGSCTRPGEPTKPSGCQDDTTVPDRVMECADANSDGEGLCTVGPIDQICTVASGHAQRSCSTIADCGGGAGSCILSPRPCFLTGGGTFQPAGTEDGTNTLIAVGMADVPVNDVSNPTLGAVFCVGPTSAPAINNVAGLPGPGRVTIKGTATGLP